jgi:hypothetical protein
MNQLRVDQLAQRYFGADAPWYLQNIPFLEIDDPEIQDVYYYRWKVFRSHIREIGPQGTMLLEFLPDVPWAREPWTDLNDSSAFHLMEGRWLRNPAVVNSLIDHLYAGGGNTRGFSEWIAAASVAAVDVTGDTAVLRRNFDGMRHIYELWDDHFTPSRNLYWVEPLADATEYTISSIDASGAGFEDRPNPDPRKNGFTGGFAFRPSINTYQYGNALAIAQIAEQAGMKDVAAVYRQKAALIQQATLQQLWNDRLQHFTDRYQRSTPLVKEGEFIRGRELVGYLPWLLEMVPKDPASSAKYDVAWAHVLSARELRGAAGVRTVEPSYPRYMAQYRFAGTKPECAWNGPSWPFQTSQMLTGLANLLDDYPSQQVVTATDYLSLLRQYTHQHFLFPGRLDLEEDYDPDQGGPIVGLGRSHHYEHSTYVDLILSGLIGIRPRADNTLEIAPLLPSRAAASSRLITYFALSGVRYRGHELALVYDATGTHYGIGEGLTVFVDGKKVSGPGPLRHLLLPLPAAPPRVLPTGQIMPEDIAVNVGFPDGPTVTASSSSSAEGLRQAIDGRLWFFPEVDNGWTPAGDPSKSESWIELSLPHLRSIGSVELYFLEAGSFHPPSALRLQYKEGNAWKDVPAQTRTPQRVIGNGRNQINFPAVETSGLRLLLPRMAATTTFRLIEWEAFAKPRT